ncbi:hypothetical protein HWQ46_05580 [Shewanella sp. D64]|uniref:hypothetical protein n=1 Tax=unclassified Shewanella TaxID=196818 RepID=UPI0022BA688F|nr:MULTISPECIES: hypothetical protein [unclassified Shewanella]MEC4725023.1 hypothetical protein [Shewanella sp. D64]MEC4736924.1 hypothetical protein [Shewanella sp. E94]WBJ96519.1 hypothetical protein HWQ47_05185 [Shewanella sp. MTB7]
MKINNILISSILALSVSNAIANEFVAKVEHKATVDQIIEAVVEQPYAPSYSEPVVNVLTDYKMDKGWGDTYEQGKFRIIKIGLTTFETKNPKTDRKFLIKRSLAASIAMLNGKAEIIKSIRTEMSASDLAVMPGSNIKAELDSEVNALNDQIDSLEMEISELENLIDDNELDRIGSLNWDDRAAALADAVIKKIDTDYDSGAISAEKKANYDKLLTDANTVKSQRSALVERAEALKGNIASENSSTIKAIAEMPLYGVISLATEERFDSANNRYEVGVLLAWSQKNELRTRSILTGNYKGELNTSSKEVQKHIHNNRQNLASMIGSSTFKDSTGNAWIIGVSGREIRGSNSSAAHGAARLQASKEAVIALYANVSTSQELEQIVRETYKDAANNITESQAVESFASSMQQSFQNKQVKGNGEIYSREIIHPITGKPTFISIYAVSAASSEAAKQIEAVNYKVNKLDIEAQKDAKAHKQKLVSESKQTESTPVKAVSSSANNASANTATNKPVLKVPEAKAKDAKASFRAPIDEEDF